MLNQEMIDNNKEMIDAQSGDVYIFSITVIPAILNEIHSFMFYKANGFGLWTNGMVLKGFLPEGGATIATLKYGHDRVMLEKL